MAKTAPSKLILDLGNKIEEKSSAKINFARGTTAPVQQWIPEAEMSATKVITLRTAKQTRQTDGVMKLQQFNPSFFLAEPGAIHCRVPGCSITTPRLKHASSSTKQIKQDLFMCEIHRDKMVDLVSKRCAKEDIFVSVVAFKHEDFNGYTYLIGALEKAFMHLMKKPATLNLPNNSNLLLAEVFLNTRNFLIITNALLNPNGDNLGVVLPQNLMLLDKILSALQDPQLLGRLVAALRDIMDIVLQTFGIIYAWVFLGATGSKIGGGAGLLVGAVAGGRCFGIPGMIVGGVIGLVAGNLLGGGGYAWYEQQQEVERQNQRIREYQEFVRQRFGEAVHATTVPAVTANGVGDMVLHEVHIPGEL